MTKTDKALNKSVAHWKRLSTGNAMAREGIYGKDCALCKLFYTNFGCDGCPVKRATDWDFCCHSPYGAAHLAYYEYGVKSKQFKAAAKKEWQFLKSLIGNPLIGKK